jgi:formamidopyrimidine-DNA glycosylase
MPELPDLEIVAEFLHKQLAGLRIEQAQLLKPIVVRDLTSEGFVLRITGQQVQSVSRRGKFLLFSLDEGDWLVIKPMRSGRLRYLSGQERVRGKPFVEWCFTDGAHLRYEDADTMGKVYLTPSLEQVPTFVDQGPEALDPALTLEAFTDRLRRRRGEVKGVLTNQAFLAGIGNAYADEILFRAGVYPFRKVPSLSAQQVRLVYQAMREVLQEALDTLRQRVGRDIHIEIRDFLQVHGRGGEPCPRCGTAISQVTARRRPTNFCRNCQPGTMLRK